MNIVLASGSPRRRELLEMLGVENLKIIPAKGEELAPAGVGTGELVKALASAKGREVAALCGEDDVIIAADTVVWFDGHVYGKPHSEKDARTMLRALSGNEHQVYTGVYVKRGERELCEFEVSHVRFRELEEREIDGYVSTGEPMDKAGAYGAQGRASLFVRAIDGDFFNVMGLPVCRLGEMLKKLGVELL